MRSIAVTFLILLPTLTRAQQPITWPPTRVQLQQHAANNPFYEKLPTGISLWQAPDPGDSVFDEFMMRWTSPDDDGPGMTGLLNDVLTDAPVEVLQFGRTANDILLQLRVHAPRDSKTAAQKVLFAAPFPRDLPPGEYTLTVELKDDKNTIQQRHTRKLVHRPEQASPLTKLSDEELLAEYVRRGEMLKGSGLGPRDTTYTGGAAMFSQREPRLLAWQQAGHEIIRRQTMVPALIKMLESESVRNPGATAMQIKFGFAFDLMEILTQMRDPRPAPILIHILRGMEGRANISVRQRALQTLESLTYFCFVIDRDTRLPEVSLLSPSAVTFPRRDLEIPEKLSEMAAIYARWYAKEGNDPAAWLISARAQARKTLMTDDAYFVQNAAQFLIWCCAIQPDDAPQQSLKALDYAISRNDRILLYNADVADYLGHFGPLARTYLPRMIQSTRRYPSAERIYSIGRVGGQPAVEFLVELLPTLRQRAEKTGLPLDFGAPENHDYNALETVRAYHYCRLGIERGVARTFDTDDQILTWYAANKSKSERQWLEESLDSLISQADAGNRRARYLAKQIVPALPAQPDDDEFRPDWCFSDTVPYYESQTPTPNHPRQTWLNEHRPRLQFDPNQSQFILKK